MATHTYPLSDSVYENSPRESTQEARWRSSPDLGDASDVVRADQAKSRLARILGSVVEVGLSHFAPCSSPVAFFTALIPFACS